MWPPFAHPVQGSGSSMILLLGKYLAVVAILLQ
jgi:hypothetical protein